MIRYPLYNQSYTQGLGAQIDLAGMDMFFIIIEPPLSKRALPCVDINETVDINLPEFLLDSLFVP